MPFTSESTTPLDFEVEDLPLRCSSGLENISSVSWEGGWRRRLGTYEDTDSPRAGAQPACLCSSPSRFPRRGAALWWLQNISQLLMASHFFCKACPATHAHSQGQKQPQELQVPVQSVK